MPIRRGFRRRTFKRRTFRRSFKRPSRRFGFKRRFKKRFHRKSRIMGGPKRSRFNSSAICVQDLYSYTLASDFADGTISSALEANTGHLSGFSGTNINLRVRILRDSAEPYWHYMMIDWAPNLQDMIGSSEATAYKSLFQYVAVTALVLRVDFQQPNYDLSRMQGSGGYTFQQTSAGAAGPISQYRGVGQYEHFTIPNVFRNAQVTASNVVGRSNWTSATMDPRTRIKKTRMKYAMKWKPSYMSSITDNTGAFIQTKKAGNWYFPTNLVSSGTVPTIYGPTVVFKFRLPQVPTGSSFVSIDNQFLFTIRPKIYLKFTGRRNYLDWQPYGY